MPRAKRRPRVASQTRRPRKRGRSYGPVDMRGAISSLQHARGQLISQRDLLDARIQAVDSALAAMGAALPRGPVAAGPRRGRPGGRGPRPGSLKSVITTVLTGKGIMAVKDITAGVLKAGYKTRNKTLAKSVGIALAEMKNVAKIGRGRFRLK